MSPRLPEKVAKLAQAVRAEGGRALLVGGCVRDRLMGNEPKDWDVEVYGIEPLRLRELLEEFGRVDAVGEAFTVYKVGDDLDVSLPRRERKAGRGHRAFVIEGDPAMSVEEATRRRDFTINAILEDPLTGEIIDPYGGRADLENKTLRAVSRETFGEDSLRVLRAAQFAARFELNIEPETIELCRSIELTDLPRERVWGEMEKLLLRARRPSVGFQWLHRFGAFDQLFPELGALIGVPQESEWHPEGWSLTALPPEAFVTSVAQPSGVEGRLPSLRKFLATSTARPAMIPTGNGTMNTESGETASANLPTAVDTGADDPTQPAMTPPALHTETKRLVWSFGTFTPRTDKVVRIMFKISLDNVVSIVRHAVNDFEIVRGVVHPVAIFVVNVLGAFKGASQYQLHDNAVDASGSVFTLPTGVHVTSVVVDARTTAIDNHIFFYFDLAFVGYRNSVHEEGSPSMQYFEVRVGDVFYHTQLAIDRARELIDDLPYSRQVTVMLGALCHDFGKPATTMFEEGRWRSRGHEEAGVAPTESFLDRLNIYTLDGYDVRAQVVALVRDHLKPGEFYKKRDEVGDGAFRRLARRCELELLYRVAKADSLGRNADWIPREQWFTAEAQEWFINRARELEVDKKAPAPILMGRHLLEMGLEPGTRIGEITRAVYEMQLDGRVTTLEEAKEAARRMIANGQ